MIKTFLKLFKTKCIHDFKYHHVHLCVHGLQPTHIVTYCSNCGTAKNTFYNGYYYYSKMMYPSMFYDRNEYGNKKIFDNLSLELYSYYQKQFEDYSSNNPYFEKLFTKETQK